MTDEEIFDHAWSIPHMRVHWNSADLIAFARAIAAAEREECASLAERMGKTGTNDGSDIAAAIRARGDQRDE